MFEPDVSIVIPVFNGANYLAEAIDGALSQTYKNFEVIVVDDGSTDGGATQRIAESYGSSIRYIRQENGGCGAALNTGIRAMKGEYFSWLSHDDVYLPNKLARQIEILGSVANKNTIVYGNYELMDAKSRRFHRSQFEAVGSAEQLSMPLFALTNGLIHGCTLLIAKTLFAQHGLFNPSLKTTQDYDLWFRLLRHNPLHFEPQALVLSRVHEEQGSKRLPQMQPEGVALWRQFIEDVTPEEAIQMHGSHYRYLTKTAHFLKHTPFADAAQFADEKAKRIIRETKVSVVIPFRDRIELTLKALISVQAQTHEVLEIILVDDGSTADVAPIRHAAEKDARVHYVRQDWRGASAARNRGVELATGSYVAFLDSDDMWMPDKVEQQVRFMEDRRLAFSHTDYLRRTEESGEARHVVTSYLAGNIYPQIISSCQIATPTVMAQTDLLRQHPFPENVHIGEDVLVWISIAEEHELGAIDRPLTIVTVSEESSSNSPEKSLRGTVNILAGALDHPRFRHNSQQILSLIETAHRHALSLRPRKAKFTVAGLPVKGKALEGGARPSGFVTARLLFRAGLYSLKHFGIRATWQRVALRMSR